MVRIILQFRPKNVSLYEHGWKCKIWKIYACCHGNNKTRSVWTGQRLGILTHAGKQNWTTIFTLNSFFSILKFSRNISSSLSSWLSSRCNCCLLLSSSNSFLKSRSTRNKSEFLKLLILFQHHFFKNTLHKIQHHI